MIANLFLQRRKCGYVREKTGEKESPINLLITSIKKKEKKRNPHYISLPIAYYHLHSLLLLKLIIETAIISSKLSRCYANLYIKCNLSMCQK